MDCNYAQLVYSISATVTDDEADVNAVNFAFSTNRCHVISVTFVYYIILVYVNIMSYTFSTVNSLYACSECRILECDSECVTELYVAE